MSHTLPPLPYAYNALEPYIIEEIMVLHHQKHHQTYVNALNAAEQAYAATTTPKERIALQAAIKFNGGGHINHSLFWKNMAPSASKYGSSDPKAVGGVLKDGPLAEAINRDFGSLDELKKQFNAATAGIQGSGWGWLVLDKTGRLVIQTTPNQDPVIDGVPIIGVDIWEHAFYLQYRNVKPDYLNAIWNVINFEEAEKRFVSKSSNL
ncbi:manganese superoxide dismutase [Serendipita vermifera]|nr:manganese superoxide dismutase [Serendipita vermifera]